jgi:hypothetical protein
MEGTKHLGALSDARGGGARFLSCIHACRRMRPTNCAKEFVFRGASTPGEDSQGRNLLFLVASSGSVEMYSYVHDKLAIGPVPDQRGKNVLHATCRNGQEVLIRHLIKDKGYESNDRDNRHRTGLQLHV